MRSSLARVTQNLEYDGVAPQHHARSRSSAESRIADKSSERPESLSSDVAITDLAPLPAPQHSPNSLPHNTRFTHLPVSCFNNQQQGARPTRSPQMSSLYPNTPSQPLTYHPSHIKTASQVQDLTKLTRDYSWIPAPLHSY